MLKIAHLSDPHVNLKFHPTHHLRLRNVLIHAIEEEKVDHIVITGDLTSNADQRDLLACRKLFKELDLLHPERLSLVVGNHDIYGGPHLAEDLLAFPGRCRSRDYDLHLKIFYEYFAETFRGTHGGVMPYAKILGPVALLGLNSIARAGAIKNPVGSNGRISVEDMKKLRELLALQEVLDAEHRIVLMHHHLFRRHDPENNHTYPGARRMVWRIEDETLRFRGKREFIELLKEGDVETVLHGHLHYTSEGDTKGIRCINGGGAVYPMNPEAGLSYNLLKVENQDISVEIVRVSGGVRKTSKFGRHLKTGRALRQLRHNRGLVEKV
jgi:3',5'-cyclic AMP phosphodiesterase CpdA